MKKYIFLSFLLLIGTVGFIFSLSMQDATHSNALSQETTRILATLIEALPIPSSFTLTLTNHFIRDLAHMGLFFLLGCISLLTCSLGHVGYVKSTLFTLFFGMLTALCDELIQLDSIGRAFEWVDWAKDMFGISCSLVLFSIAYGLFHLFKRAKQKST